MDDELCDEKQRPSPHNDHCKQKDCSPRLVALLPCIIQVNGIGHEQSVELNTHLVHITHINCKRSFENGNI